MINQWEICIVKHNQSEAEGVFLFSKQTYINFLQGFFSIQCKKKKKYTAQTLFIIMFGIASAHAANNMFKFQSLRAEGIPAQPVADQTTQGQRCAKLQTQRSSSGFLGSQITAEPSVLYFGKVYFGKLT